MAPLKLTYFGVTGLAEPIRWALEAGGVEWEDHRLTWEEFEGLKPSLPNEQVPVLEIDGFVLPQNQAILRYVGKLCGLYPTDALEAAKCDAIMDCTTDFRIKLRQSFVEEDEEKKIAMRKQFADEVLPIWLGNMKKHLEAGGGSYFVAGKLTVADIITAFSLYMVSKLRGIPTNILESYPSLAALVKTVMEEPKIAEFVAKHKDSERHE